MYKIKGVIKDADLISELNAGFKVEINSSTIKSPPSSYFYLSASRPDANSIAYKQSVTLPLTSGAWTSYLKYYAQHDTIRIHIENVSGGLPLRRISIDLYYYAEAWDQWYVQRYDKVRCTSSTGFAIQQILSAYQYGRFWLMRYDSVSSFDLNIWTTYAG